MTAEDKAKRMTYGEALAKGRRATVAHHYDEAIAAFDQAVGMDPDGRAYAERGYAYYLSKRNDLALKDLQMAVAAPSDAGLLAQVLFNLGLVHAALGQAPESDRAFYWSNNLHPTAAAAGHLTGKKVCPIAVDRTRVLARAYGGWLEWANAMAGAGGMGAQGYQLDSTEANAAKRFCGDCASDGPWLVTFGAFEGTWPQFWEVHVMARGGGKIWDYGKVSEGAEGPVTGEPCFTGDQPSLTIEGRLAFVENTSFPLIRYPVVMGEQGNLQGDCPMGSADCQRVCMGSSATRTFTVLSVDQHARVMTVVESNYFERAESMPSFDVVIEPTSTGLKVGLDACGTMAASP
jgi:hypothetical protein